MIYFFDAYGRITRRVQCPFNEAAFMAQEGEQWIQSDEMYSDDRVFIFNGAITPFPPSPGDEWKWDWADLCWVFPADALEQVKGSKRAEIDAARNLARYSGVTFNGVLFDSDPVSAGNLTGWTAAVAAGIPIHEGFTWRSQDNRDIPFTSADILGLAAAMVTKTTACYQRSWSLKAELDELPDYQQVKDFDITTGWPE